jgi:RNA 3'-terminal phosphate cyclase (ATP)
MTEIDGSIGEGGGQILRTALSLAAIYHRAIRISNIRAGRKEPGLRPQHLESVLAASKISGGSVSGASVGSTQIEFTPGVLPKKIVHLIDTGTAGSISLIAQTLIPIAIFGGVELETEIRGGTEVPNAPTVDYLSRLVIPIYRKLGAVLDLELARRGYYPRGGGIVRLNCSRVDEPKPFEFLPQETTPLQILSVSRKLPSHVATRQAESAIQFLSGRGLKAQRSDLDTAGDSLSPGSSILIYQSDSSHFVGASSLGERGKSAESVGSQAAEIFAREIRANPNVDSHLSDMLVTLLSCVPGKSRFLTSFLTNHFWTNCEVAKKLTGCEIATQRLGEAFQVEIVGSPEKPN